MTQRDPANIAFESRVLLAAKVIVAPASYEFRDMGFDPATQEVGIVGYEGTGTVGVTKIAKLFELNGTQDGFTAQTLVGLGPGTQVYGISSDSSRIAGVSHSPSSTGFGEGTTWLRSHPSSPVGIGYLTGFSNSSVGYAAWKDGVVGHCGGGDAACKWSPASQLVALAEHEGGLANAFDTSLNGQTQVGFSSHEVFDGVAYFWDSTGIHRLEDPYNIQSVAYSISPNGDFIGGYVGEVDSQDNDYLNAAVWDSQRNLTLLKDSTGNRFQGKVYDVSNNG